MRAFLFPLISFLLKEKPKASNLRLPSFCGFGKRNTQLSMSNLIKNGVKGNSLTALLNLFNYQINRDTCEAFNNVGQLRKIETASSDTAVVLPQEMVRSNSFRLLHNDTDAFKKLAKRVKKKAMTYIDTAPFLAWLNKNKPDAKISKGVRFTTYKCGDILEHKADGTIVGAYYCKQRWCKTCESIRMRKSAKGLYESINEWKGKTGLVPYLVTLTLQNCVAAMDRYKDLLDFMQNKVWKRIRDLARKKRLRFDGYYSVETTYNPKCYFKSGPNKGKFLEAFHPHFHFLVFGEEQAAFLKETWQKLASKLAEEFTGEKDAGAWFVSSKAQDNREVDCSSPESLLELVKYSVKGSSTESEKDEGGKEKKGGRKREKAYPHKIRYILYEAHHGRRLFNCFGKFKVNFLGSATRQSADGVESAFEETDLVASVSLPNTNMESVFWHFHRPSMNYVPCFDGVVYPQISIAKSPRDSLVYKYGEDHVNKFINNSKVKDKLYNSEVGDNSPPKSRGWFDGAFTDSDCVKESDREFEKLLRPILKSGRILSSGNADFIRVAADDEFVPQALQEYLLGMGFELSD